MNFRFFLSLTLLSMVGLPAKALAHGVAIQHQLTQAISIQAAYDTGEPMVDAQVVVYAPNDPSQAWTTGKTDAKGQFIFMPDRAQTGNWQVSVRQAGHGDILNIPIAGDANTTTAADSANPMTSLQKGVMVGSIIWGFIGTALFFARGKK
jgi:nickel transport protein